MRRTYNSGEAALFCKLGQPHHLILGGDALSDLSKVLVIDADLGLADMNIAFGVSPKFSLKDVAEGRITAWIDRCPEPRVQTRTIEVV